jgi:hypothetical protein
MNHNSALFPFMILYIENREEIEGRGGGRVEGGWLDGHRQVNRPWLAEEREGIWPRLQSYFGPIIRGGCLMSQS